MKKILLALILGSAALLSGTASFAQKASKDSTARFKVSGVCGLCKNRIEVAAKGKGVRSADWDLATGTLTLSYDPARTTPRKVQERIAAAGHDNEGLKADDAVYQSLHECCLYRELAPESSLHGQQPEAAPAPDSVQQKVPEASGGQAATGHYIKGVVLADDGRGTFHPLAGASVVWLGTGQGTATDSFGFFSLPPLPGAQQLVVSYSGYRPDTLKAGSASQLTVVLAGGKDLHSVTVTSRRAATYINSYEPIRKVVISQRELLKAACCNLSESFETNPSVDVSFSDAVTGSKQIQLLGLSGNYTQLTVENLPGPRGLATALGLNSIPGTWVESIQLIKGTGSVVNGYESIAGQINVELKKPGSSAEQLYANSYVNDFGKTDLNLNLSKKLSNRWSAALLLHDAFGNRKVDMNGDGFRDLPTGNLFSGLNRWNYEDGKGIMAQLGVKLLLDEKTGGQVAFDPSKHQLTRDQYGLGIDINRKEAFAKFGYVFPQKKYQSIGLQLSVFDHRQEAYFGQTTYKGRQKNFYSNLIYQSIIGSEQHKFRTGMSFVLDKYDEAFKAADFERVEAVPGAFFEYTYRPSEKMDVVAGIRADRNSLTGWLATPRLNIRYEPVKGTVVRLSAGRGQRTANIFAENNSVLVSSRQVVLPAAATGAYGLRPEVSWNKGLTIDQKLRLFNRAATLSAEYFRNDFTDQVIVDLEEARSVKFYNLDGRSFSNSFQTELSFEPAKRLEARLAYRFFDVRATYGGQLLQKPFTARHRAFANLGYELGDWKFDYTVSYNGSKRLPSTSVNPEAYRLEEKTPGYVLMNAQVSRAIGKKYPVELYIGGENLTGLMQDRAVLAADEPFGAYFDASLVWGPISGRMIYGGLRFRLN